MSWLFLYVYVTAIGFVAAGVIGSTFQLITGEPLRFSIDRRNGVVLVIFGVIARVMAGPFILLRNSIRGRLIEKRPLGWIAASAVISVTWSFMSGVVIFETLANLTNKI